MWSPGRGNCYCQDRHTISYSMLSCSSLRTPAAGFQWPVAVVASLTGMRVAGKHGIGLLSIRTTLIIESFYVLAYHWGVVEECAAAFGTKIDSTNWSSSQSFSYRRDG